MQDCFKKELGNHRGTGVQEESTHEVIAWTKRTNQSMAIKTLERRCVTTGLCMPPGSYGNRANNINGNDAGAHTSRASNYCNGSERNHWRSGFGEDTKQINHGCENFGTATACSSLCLTGAMGMCPISPDLIERKNKRSEF